MKKIYRIIVFTFITIFIGLISVNADDLISKSKTATDLDSDFDTKITLELNPRKEEIRQMDIVLMVDADAIRGAKGKNFIKESSTLIQRVNENAYLKANIAIVAYGFESTIVMDLTDSEEITGTDYLDAKIAAKSDWYNNNYVQSNLQKGLLLAKDILDNSSSGAKDKDKAIILLSDGGHFTYNNADGETASAIYRSSERSFMTMGNMDSNGDVGNKNRETKMTQYVAQANGDYVKAFEKLLGEYETIDAIAKGNYRYGVDSGQYNDDIIAKINSGELTTVYSSVADVENLSKYPYTGMEIGTVEAAHTIQNIKEKYSFYGIGYIYPWGFDDSLEGLWYRLLAYPSYSFVKWLSNTSSFYLEETKEISSARYDELFNKIYEEMNPIIERETYLIDEMGFGKYPDGSDYDFDFVNELEKLSISVDGEVLGAVKINDSTYGFGEDTTLPEGYKFILTYYENGITGITENECLKIAINQDIKDGAPIEISYHEVLKEETRKEDFGVYKNLKTSNSTILYLVNGVTESFSIPQVSYEVKAPNPNTKDIIITYLVLLVASLTTLISLIYLKRKTLKN